MVLLPDAAFARGHEVRWSDLAARLGDRLIKVRSPLDACAAAGGSGADELFAACKNPYFIGDEPGLTQTLGWTDAWTSRASDYAVAAQSASDVAEAVRFARREGVAVVVKGGGHSYLGNSNRAGSLLIWTRRLRDITFHDAFRGAGWPAGADGVPAVSVGAGCLWGHVYQAAARRGLYVQGGGCLTVGVAGFALGGGFGWFSKQFGTGAANLLEAEIVTADGRVRTVNAEQEGELFFALRGGGGGTFGVVTRLTFRTFPLPEQVGIVQFRVTAADDAAWRALVERMMQVYGEALLSPRWGEQIRFMTGRRMSVSMMCHGLGRAEMQRIWQPFLGWIKASPQLYALESEPLLTAFPGSVIFDADALRQAGFVMTDARPGADARNIYWKDNVGEAGQMLHAYKSAWLPKALLGDEARPALVEALIAASAQWTISLHTNKGLGGGDAGAIARTRETAMNPAVLDAFALLICAADGAPAYPGITGHEPDVANGRREAAGVAAAFAPIERLVPDAGSYMSESDFFERDYKRAYWGANYPRLAAAKRRYDPDATFIGRNCVEFA